MSLLKGIDRMRDMLLEKRNVLRAGFGGARHGQIVAGQGLACDGECNACAVQGRRRATQADRDSPPGYRKPARPDGANARRAVPLYRAFWACRDTAVIPARQRLQELLGRLIKRNSIAAGAQQLAKSRAERCI